VVDSETAKGYGFNKKVTAIRQFGKYLNSVGEDAYVLPEKFVSHDNRKIPYVLTDMELSALFSAIDKLPENRAEPFVTEIAPVLFRLIYTCGLRPNEGREPRRNNINLETGEILITHTKRNKEHLYQCGMDLTLVSQWLGHVNLETTKVYAHADTELKRKAIASATQQSNPLRTSFNPTRFKVTDEEMLKRLYGLK